MAIDTRDKRASAIGLPTFWIAPIPDGTIDAADRLQIAGLYRGIAAVSIVFVFEGMPWYFAVANRPSDVAPYLEVYFRAITGTVHARLYNLTTSAEVSGSSISTTNANLRRLRSAVLSLVDGEYILQLGKPVDAQGNCRGARVVIIYS